MENSFFLKLQKQRLRNDAKSNYGKRIVVTSSKGKSYTFIHKKNKFKNPALYPEFDVLNDAHIYADGSVCMADVKFYGLTSEALDTLIRYWVEAYETYVICGYWGYEETKHKKYLKEEK